MASTFYVTQEGPVNALALNRDNTQVAIGGRNVFKVYKIEEDKFREVCNLRPSKHLNLSFSCNDVSWSLTDDNYLATAATNGHVCVWNLTKMGKAMQEQDYQEHKRTVNKVNFHVSEPNRLISGSQDGTMRYFDIRLKSAVAIFYSNTESVRDVQFSPHSSYTFAAVSENGSVQLWDVRKPDKCQQQYTAHSGPIFACDWHPECSWLATASRDKTIKVWDLTTKPTLEHTIHTIASIGHVKWRPQFKFHIASCALVVDCSINIWDVRRPYIPYAAFNEHKDIASGVAWKGDPHIFLSTGRDCTLYHHSFNSATRPANKANPQGISLNNKGEVIYAHKIHSNVNLNMKSGVTVIRKSSNTQSVDQFHLASSYLQQFYFNDNNNNSNGNNNNNNINNKLSQDSDRFIGLATNYLLNGCTLSEMCEHNSLVAKRYGKLQISTFWQIIKTMYGEEYIQNSAINSNNNTNINNNRDDVLSHVSIPNTNLVNESSKVGDGTNGGGGGGGGGGAQFSGGDDETENEDQVDHIAIYSNGFPTYLNLTTGLPKGDFSFGENELDMELDGDYRNGFHRTFQPILPSQTDWTLPNEAFHIRHEIRDRSPPPEQFPNSNSPDITTEDSQTFINNGEDHQRNMLTISLLPETPIWDPSNIVLEALKHHANLGDIQTVVSVLIVLGEQRKCLLNLDENLQEHWLLGYIELLSRFQLWNIVTQIIKLSWIPSVNQLNQQSTRFNTSCSKCTKPLQRVGWLCDRCHSTQSSLCSVCHQVVKGLYVWCQGCSHGGHLMHIQEFFSRKRTCPTGCGHYCEFNEYK